MPLSHKRIITSWFITERPSIHKDCLTQIMSESILYIATILLSILPVIYTGSKFSRPPNFLKKKLETPKLLFLKFKDQRSPSPLPAINNGAPLVFRELITVVLSKKTCSKICQRC